MIRRERDGSLVCATSGMEVLEFGDGQLSDEDGRARCWSELDTPMWMTRSTKVNDKTKAIRKTVAEVGYKALTGTTKQKQWAEKLRKDVVDRLPENIKHGLVEYSKASFWIENRDDGQKLFTMAEQNADRVARELALRHAYLVEKAAHAKRKMEAPVFVRIRALAKANGIRITMKNAFFRPAWSYHPMMDLTDEQLLDVLDIMAPLSKLTVHSVKHGQQASGVASMIRSKFDIVL